MYGLPLPHGSPHCWQRPLITININIHDYLSTYRSEGNTEAIVCASSHQLPGAHACATITDALAGLLPVQPPHKQLLHADFVTHGTVIWPYATTGAATGAATTTGHMYP